MTENYILTYTFCIWLNIFFSLNKFSNSSIVKRNNLYLERFTIY